MAKLQFDAVHLDHPVDRLGGGAGTIAYANTEFFSSSKGGYTIELDTATDLVTITNRAKNGAVVVPIGRVKRFEPLLPMPEETKPAGK